MSAHHHNCPAWGGGGCTCVALYTTTTCAGVASDTACHPFDEQAEITTLKQRVAALEETVRRLMAREKER